MSTVPHSNKFTVFLLSKMPETVTITEDDDIPRGEPRNNTFLYVGIAIMVLFVLGGVALYFYQKRRSDKEFAEELVRAAERVRQRQAASLGRQ